MARPQTLLRKLHGALPAAFGLAAPARRHHGRVVMHMSSSDESRPHPTVDQLRDDIDAGRTGDKVDGSDPAAVPLGVDEEAAGTPLAATQVRQARDYETSRRAIPPQRRSGLGDTWILIGFVLLFTIGIIAAWAIKSG